jgi:hypothetical protein
LQPLELAPREHFCDVRCWGYNLHRRWKFLIRKPNLKGHLAPSHYPSVCTAICDLPKHVHHYLACFYEHYKGAHIIVPFLSTPSFTLCYHFNVVDFLSCQFERKCHSGHSQRSGCVYGNPAHEEFQRMR